MTTTTKLIASHLVAHHLHVAETYVSKAGLRDQVGQVMDLLRDVQSDVGSVNECLDRVIETRHPPQSRQL